MPTMNGAGILGQQFFFYDEIAALDALVARIVPGDADDPGAREAGVTTDVVRPRTGEVSHRIRSLVTSLPPEQADPSRLLRLSRDHWGIENRLFHVADDSFGEDRQVLHAHAAGSVLGLLRTAALNLLRGECPLWTTKTPLTARAESVNDRPSVVLAALEGL